MKIKTEELKLCENIEKISRYLNQMGKKYAHYKASCTPEDKPVSFIQFLYIISNYGYIVLTEKRDSQLYTSSNYLNELLQE